jgi:hypothetical protein
MDRLSNEVFENAIKSANGLSDASKTSYLKQLRQALKLIQPQYHLILGDPSTSNATLKLLVEKQSISQNTARSIIAALLSLFKHVPESIWMRGEKARLQTEWASILEEHNKKVIDWTEQNLLSPREEEGWVSLKEWQAKEYELRSAEPGSYRHLLVAFHVLMTPLRGGDLSLVQFVTPTDPLADETKKDTKDVLTWSGPDKPSRLLIRSHKTRKSFPVLVRELSKDLRSVVAMSLKLHPKREYLFMSSAGKPWSRSAFLAWKTRTLHELFSRPVTTNLARHAYVTSKKTQNESIASQRKDASEMGHSLKTHNEYRKLVK